MARGERADGDETHRDVEALGLQILDGRLELLHRLAEGEVARGQTERVRQRADEVMIEGRGRCPSKRARTLDKSEHSAIVQGLEPLQVRTAVSEGSVEPAAHVVEALERMGGGDALGGGADQRHRDHIIVREHNLREGSPRRTMRP